MVWQVLAKAVGGSVVKKLETQALRKIMSKQFQAKAMNSLKGGSKAKNTLKSLDKKGLKNQSKGLGNAIAKAFKNRLIINILENHYNFRLSDKTIKRKGSSLPFVETKSLIGAIYARGTRVSVYNKRRKSPRSKGLTNLQLFYILEYGCKDKGIPARPVWRNTYRDFDKEKAKIVKEFNRCIRKELGSIKFVC